MKRSIDADGLETNRAKKIVIVWTCGKVVNRLIVERTVEVASVDRKLSVKMSLRGTFFWQSHRTD